MPTFRSSCSPPSLVRKCAARASSWVPTDRSASLRLISSLVLLMSSSSRLRKLKNKKFWTPALCGGLFFFLLTKYLYNSKLKLSLLVTNRRGAPSVHVTDRCIAREPVFQVERKLVSFDRLPRQNLAVCLSIYAQKHQLHWLRLGSRGI